ncbi:IclR helix-turn-helix domain protein [Candidatus Norongarragalina meridionalis]|nr:IclR helix-turn-helix domain protein [Candidatus Norongarragalina meridionalis]
MPAPKTTDKPAKTREHYVRQRDSSFVYYRVRADDAARTAANAFNIYDFVSNAFAFSPKRKEAFVRVLEALREKPQGFTELMETSGLARSALYLLVLSLERSGLVRKEGRKYALSDAFSSSAEASAAWWKRWKA